MGEPSLGWHLCRYNGVFRRQELTLRGLVIIEKIAKVFTEVFREVLAKVITEVRAEVRNEVRAE